MKIINNLFFGFRKKGKVKETLIKIWYSFGLELLILITLRFSFLCCIDSYIEIGTKRQ